jgi:hypothetical protein
MQKTKFQLLKMIFRCFTELFPFDRKQVLVNRKHGKRYEFFHSFIHSGASCALETGGVLKRGNPGCRSKNFGEIFRHFAKLFPSIGTELRLGLTTDFVSGKFRGIEWFLLFRIRKCSFRGIFRFTEDSIQKLGTEQTYMKKVSFTKNPAPANRIERVFSSAKCVKREF